MCFILFFSFDKKRNHFISQCALIFLAGFNSIQFKINLNKTSRMNPRTKPEPKNEPKPSPNQWKKLRWSYFGTKWPNVCCSPALSFFIEFWHFCVSRVWHQISQNAFYHISIFFRFMVLICRENLFYCEGVDQDNSAIFQMPKKQRYFFIFFNAVVKIFRVHLTHAQGFYSFIPGN